MPRITINVDNLLDMTQAAALLGISRQTLYALIDRGELIPIAIGSSRFLLHEHLEALAARRGTPLVEPHGKRGPFSEVHTLREYGKS